jgi:hypothetical protein
MLPRMKEIDNDTSIEDNGTLIQKVGLFLSVERMPYRAGGSGI